MMTYKNVLSWRPLSSIPLTRRTWEMSKGDCDCVFYTQILHAFRGILSQPKIFVDSKKDPLTKNFLG